MIYSIAVIPTHSTLSSNVINTLTLDALRCVHVLNSTNKEHTLLFCQLLILIHWLNFGKIFSKLCQVHGQLVRITLLFSGPEKVLILSDLSTFS